MDRNIVISLKTILLTLGVGIFFWFLVQIQGVIFALFISLIIALGLEPIVDYLVSRKVGRGLAVSITMVLTLGVVGGLIYVAVTPMVDQTKILLRKLPDFITTLTAAPWAQSYFGRFEAVDNNLLSQFSSTSSNVVRATLGAFSGFLSLVTVIVFTIYLLLEFDVLKSGFLRMLDKRNAKKAEKLISEIENKLGSWLRGEVALMFIVGFLTWIGLTVLGVDFALSLALIAGLLELVPNFGPVISAFPAAIVGFSQGTFTGFGVIGLFILVQQLENNLIVPKVMQKAVGFNPLLIIILVLIGGKLFGVLGVILAVPVASVIATIVKHSIADDL